jgi:hypothetical protein
MGAILLDAETHLCIHGAVVANEVTLPLFDELQQLMREIGERGERISEIVEAMFEEDNLMSIVNLCHTGK